MCLDVLMIFSPWATVWFKFLRIFFPLNLPFSKIWSFPENKAYKINHWVQFLLREKVILHFTFLPIAEGDPETRHRNQAVKSNDNDNESNDNYTNMAWQLKVLICIIVKKIFYFSKYF